MPLDLMSALGAPDDSEPGATPKPMGNAAETGKPSLLDKEDPVFTAHLMDAVDDSLDPQSRAEALCQAIKAYVANPKADSEPDDDDETEEEPDAEGFGGDY